MAGFAAAVPAFTIEINENIARFRAFAWSHDAAALKFIHDAGSAGVAEAEAALHERDAGFLLGADHFDALLDQFLIFIATAFTGQADRLGKLLVDFHFIARLALLRE